MAGADAAVVVDGPYFFIKRLGDVFLALVALVCLSWLFLLVAIAIKLDSPGPVIFVQERIGKDGKPFRLYKFRSMVQDAEAQLDGALGASYAREFKIPDDPRITSLGGFLRGTNIDELPQLCNILRGEMSFVGPRPLLAREVEKEYTESERRLLLCVRPGLTGPWQVSDRHRVLYENGERQAIELSYPRSCSAKTDIGLIFKTFKVVLRTVKKSAALVDVADPTLHTEAEPAGKI